MLQLIPLQLALILNKHGAAQLPPLLLMHAGFDGGAVATTVAVAVLFVACYRCCGCA